MNYESDSKKRVYACSQNEQLELNDERRKATRSSRGIEYSFTGSPYCNETRQPFFLNKIVDYGKSSASNYNCIQLNEVIDDQIGRIKKVNGMLNEYSRMIEFIADKEYIS